MKKITISILSFLQSSSIINLEQKHLAILTGIGPTILYNLVSLVEKTKLTRISSSIWAKERYFAFLQLSKKRKKTKNDCPKAARSSPKTV